MYNSEQYIRDAIDSCLSQTYGNIEIIVIDDGSTDNSKEEILDYVKVNRIRYFYQSNKGRSAARNHGLDVAEGEYINFLDSDDLLHQSKIEKHMNYMNSNENYFASYSAVEYFDNVTKKQINVLGFAYKRKYISDDLMTGNFLPIQSVLFKRSAIRFDKNVHIAEDWQFFINALYTKKVHFIDELLSFVRIENQTSKKYRLKLREGQLALLFKLLKDSRFKSARIRIVCSIFKYAANYCFLKLLPKGSI